MTKLKLEMEVVHVEANLIDKTKVIRVDKENGTAVLANGIVLNREILKKGYFYKLFFFDIFLVFYICILCCLS